MPGQKPIGFHCHNNKPSVVFHESELGLEKEYETTALIDVHKNFYMGEKELGTLEVVKHPEIGVCLVTRIVSSFWGHYHPVKGQLKKGDKIECEKILGNEGTEWKFHKKSKPRHFLVKNFPSELNKKIKELLKT